MKARATMRAVAPSILAGRTLLALIALCAAYFSAIDALARLLERRDAARAHQIAPWDAQHAARYARNLATAQARPNQLAVADRVARRALLGDATAVDAVVALGTSALLRNDADGARRYFSYAQRLSNRELATQLWAIEDAVARNDIAGALKNYDIALRTSRNAASILFPLLANAITEPEVRSELVKLLAARPSWGAGFLFHAAGNGSDPRATAALFKALRKARLSPSEASQAVLVDTLLSHGMAEDAWSYFSLIRPGADRSLSRDPHFSLNAPSRSAFDWQLFSGDGIDTSIERDERGNLFSFSTAPSSDGLMLRQMEMLPMGSYVLQGRSAELDQPTSSRPYWQFRCQDGRELGKVVLPGTNEGETFQGRFVVPANCPIQSLSLFARSTDKVGGVEGRIYETQLRQMR